METQVPRPKPQPKPAELPTPSAVRAPSQQALAAKAKLPRYLTRRGAVEYINNVIGIPVKESTLAKKAMRGTGLPPDRYYGKVELFFPETVERWALRELCGDKPFRLEAG
jgi:hypothetical protein